MRAAPSSTRTDLRADSNASNKPGCNVIVFGRTLALGCASGILGFLAFATKAGSVAIFITLVPLIVSVSELDPLRACLVGWFAGLIGCAGGFAWALPAIARLQQISVTEALPYFLAFAGYAALQVGIFAGGVSWSFRGTTFRGEWFARSALIASLWVLLEGLFPKPVPWSFGDVLAEFPSLRQAADIGGVYGLSFLVAAINATLAAGLLRRRPLHALFVASSIVGALHLYGSVSIDSYAAPRALPDASSSHLLQVGMAQGAIAPQDTNGNRNAWDVYSRLTQDGLSARGEGRTRLNTREVRSNVERSELFDDQGGFELEVWPESVLRTPLAHNRVYLHLAGSLVSAIGRPLIIGALDMPDGAPGQLNAAYLITRATARESEGDEVETQIYHKRTLFPFGEYVPGDSWVPLLNRWRTTGHFVSGSDSRGVSLFSLYRADGHSLLLAPSICFELLWPGVFRRQLLAGASVLVNITDDGWLGATFAPYQHLRAGILRAVESRRWLLRASNSGISAIIDPTGQPVETIPFATRATVSHLIDVENHPQTLYTKWGDWPLAASALAALFCIASLRRNTRAEGGTT
jgi:apolipoprotein N-acyltransferase